MLDGAGSIGDVDTVVQNSGRAHRKLTRRLYPEAGFILGGPGSENPDPRLPGKTLVAGFG